MARKQVGVDIGSTAIRVAQVDGLDSDSLAKVSKAAIVPLTPGAVVNGRIKDSNMVGFTLGKALKAAGVNGYGIVVGSSTPEAAIVPVKLPLAIKPSDWVSAVTLQGNQISPRVPLSDSAISLFQVGQDDDIDARFLLAAATSRNEAAALASAVRLAKAAPRAIDLAGAATMRALSRAFPGTSDVVTVVDIGATKTTVVTRQGPFMRSVRTLEIGGEDITRALMGAADESFDISERRKRSLELKPASITEISDTDVAGYGSVEKSRVAQVTTVQQRVEESLRFSCDQLIEQVAGVIESETVKYPNAPTQGIVLAGGGSLLRGLKEAFHQRTGVDVLLGRPWATFTSSPGSKQVLEQMDEPSAMVELSTAIGLALWGAK